jgi:hypothetical protein
MQVAGGGQGKGQATEPAAQGVALAGGAQRLQVGHGERVGRGPADLLQVHVPQVVHQLRGVSLMSCNPGQHRGKGRPAPLQGRDHLMAQEIALEAVLAIAGVVHPVQPVALGIGPQGRPGKLEQGASQPARAEDAPRAHGGETVGARASQQVQEDRLRLVILVVGREHDVPWAHGGCERLVPNLTRRGLGALTRRGTGLHFEHDTGHSQPLAGRPAVPGPRVGIPLQAVVDVHGTDLGTAELRTQPRHGVQQDMGVQATTVGHPVPVCRRQLGQGGKETLRGQIGRHPRGETHRRPAGARRQGQYLNASGGAPANPAPATQGSLTPGQSFPGTGWRAVPRDAVNPSTSAPWPSLPATSR